MPARLPPHFLLSGAIALSLVLAAVMLGLAMDQRWLGLRLTTQPDLDIVWIEAVDRQGPSREIAPSSVLLAVTGRGGERIDIGPDDLIEEPDTLPTYEAMRAFFVRQTRIAEALSLRPVAVDTEFLSAARRHEVRPAPQRPVTSLPLALWMQIGVGLAGFWTGMWIWSLRRGEWATRFLALAGAGLMISAFPAAVYSTRELAMPGELFRLLSAFNSIGALTFGVGMIGLFLVYPRRLVSERWLVVPVIVFAIWQTVDLLEWVNGPGVGRYLPIVLAMIVIVVLIAVQFHITRGDPKARAALSWLGLAVVVGAGAFVATVIAPGLFGLASVVSQGVAFLFFLIVHVGVALGVARFKLFELDEWAFRILFYVIGVMLLLVIDAALIVSIVDERAPAFALSLVIVSLAWLPLRDTLARVVLRRREPARDNLFRQVMDVALTPPGRDQHARWRALLEDAYRPLSIAPFEGGGAPALVEDGLALTVPATGGLPSYRLDYASRGRKLFSPRDRELAAELCAMLANALESREAFETGVRQERERIARDIHDSIGLQLMGALHSRDHGRKDMMIRETLTDLRDIVNNASNPDLSLDELLADLRSQTSEHLFAAGVSMTWQAHIGKPVVLPLQVAHTLRAIVREAVQNALKHAAPGSIRIALRCHDGMISINVADDGTGFDPDAVEYGNGLANMRARAAALGGRFEIASNAGGTCVEVQLPLQIG